MSNIALRKKIDRLAESISQIKPRPIVRCEIMGQPPDDASDEVKSAYQKELDAAQAAGVFVIQLVGLKPDTIKPDAPIQPDTIRQRWQKPADRQPSL